MHKVSDGQCRRVQICMGLLHVFQVLLLDEVTVDLDVVARMDLLSFLMEECEQRGATVVYSTHIFDGLESWATHLAYVEDGKLKQTYTFPDIFYTLDRPKTLLRIVEPLLRAERKHRENVAASGGGQVKSAMAETSPWSSRRHMAYYR
ncbi:hypothetical protein O6H91_17G059500 [Diphasiastrum complanatum]|uniref:Uncharacterized protein n=1 Tax=Diphasiastrum complanatum TaxID=34168 RepID=A0ACC2B7E6_DIPCM|nr:hypothetical protein O6H91_17G059500 [Diphasiastrum complanatum]